MSEQGLKAVFVEVRPMLLRPLAARLGNREDAEDALQDLWIKIDRFSEGPIADPAAFLYRAAANLATDRRVAAQRRGVRETGWLETQPDANEWPNAERVLIARSQLKRVEAVLAAMPDRMRTALQMFRIEGRSQRDIAADLGITVSGVEKLLRRAYRQILEVNDINGAGTADRCRLGSEGAEDGA